MEQLRVIGSEDDTLVLATESGARFTLPVDDVLRSELKRSHRQTDAEPRGPRLNPRDVQSRIRAGMTATEVAEALGVTVEDVARYEGPVLAEREHIVDQALAVPVLVAGDIDEASQTFGGAVRAKLGEAHATGERWSSWKDDRSWIVKLEFTSAEVDHDARWSFEPRRGTLSPLNADATQLSRQGSLPEGLIPRLRALDTPTPKDDSRFDLEQFGPRRMRAEAEEAAAQAAPAQDAAPAAVQYAAIKRAPEQSQPSSETADLLEALRRRRGQRAPAPEAPEDSPAVEPPHPMALFDALEPGYKRADEPSPADDDDQRPSSPAGEARRKGRPAMPSWDEIVFGARTDDN
ncbi:septation protein SepH [Microbacterium horticulturae]|uniref:Septation protein SepH n=1 Tax=Microbacterium horticulturae TaxID=3028316 RepID=A0ABY8C1W3_9MICO|nr:septation protein SepH [Microbacterium sp. KACC 23027]WEG10449.1 septation protein SepH [Microbacterium sp. KACC 23027]